jgi:hypothetical protein
MKGVKSTFEVQEEKPPEGRSSFESAVRENEREGTTARTMHIKPGALKKLRMPRMARLPVGRRSS